MRRRGYRVVETIARRAISRSGGSSPPERSGRSARLGRAERAQNVAGVMHAQPRAGCA
jgi:hypothetical protein